MTETRDPGERAALYLGDVLPSDERAQFERDVLEQDDLAEALYAELNLDEALRESAATSSARPALGRGPFRGAGPLWRVILPLAASLAILFLVPSTVRHLREPTAFRSGATSLVLRSPIGDVPAFPREFVWEPDPRATSYEIVVTDDEARVLVREITLDPKYVLSDDVATNAGGGFWTVTVRDANGFEVATSQPERFHVRP
jgi:hypothetical protein